ncbi:MAG TPA: NAD-dependent epimerase/dehydratase family protein, partial [Candidatus Krumholzibacteria bacterium]|nr:NAD-dependent epimerase/dehydratase family protein [Candidatus Krumholzibacteria bacterium]
MSSTGRAQIESLQALLDRDLDYVCENLRGEFSKMAGKRVLMTGGAGFLGYYMVQSVLHWNDRAGTGDKIHMTVFDNYVRGVPAWLEALEGRKDLTLTRFDIRHPLPDPMPEFEYIIHAAGIASPKYYRERSLETMDANI